MQAYFDFLQFSLSDEMPLPATAHEIDYAELLSFAERQAIVGVLFCGVKKLPRELCPPQNILFQWIVKAENIKRNNIVTLAATEKIRAFCLQKGYRSVVLKGQSNALLYPTPWSRASGDIDIWLSPNGKIYSQENQKEVLAFARKELGASKYYYHNTAVRSVDGISVEAHYRLCFLHNLIHNRRLQRWISNRAEEQFCNIRTREIDGKAVGFASPTQELNIVFQLTHISSHFFQQGVGLRQFIDYHFVLQSEATPFDKAEWKKTLKYLGLYKLAKATMWVLSYTLKTDKETMIAEPSERLGRIMLDDIMKSGNFGHHDPRVSAWRRNTAIGRNLQRFRRDLRLCLYFPSETLWEPVFRLWHFVWRQRNKK